MQTTILDTFGHRVLLVGIAAGILLAGSAASAQAASLTLDVKPNTNSGSRIIEDKEFSLVATGDAPTDDRYVLKAIAKPARSGGCSSSYGSEPERYGSPWGLLSEDVSGTFSKPADDFQVADPGEYLACGWLQEIGDGKVLRTSSKAFQVAEPQSELSLEVPVVASGQSPQLLMKGSTELPRQLYLSLQRGSGIRCAPSYGADARGEKIDSFDDVYGDISQSPGQVTLGSLDPGTYTVCGWIQESVSDARAEKVATTSFTIGNNGIDGNDKGDGGSGAPNPPAGACQKATEKVESLKKQITKLRNKIKKPGISKKLKKALKRALKGKLRQYKKAQAAAARACA